MKVISREKLRRRIKNTQSIFKEAKLVWFYHLMLEIKDKQISATIAIHMLHDLSDSNVLPDKLFNADVNQTNTLSNF